MKKAIYAGSFDPPTLGHLDIIDRGLKLFGNITVLVASNLEKKNKFTSTERIKMLKSIYTDENVKIEAFEGLLADYIKTNNVDVVLRGLRNVRDFQYEQEMAQLNSHLVGCDVDTVFLMCDPRLSYITSSGVRQIAALGGNIKGLVPDKIVKTIEDRFR